MTGPRAILVLAASALVLATLPTPSGADAPRWTTVPLQAEARGVQPFTGIVLWDDSGEPAKTDAIQLEFSYLRYADVVRGKDRYDWSLVDRKLAAIAGRGHHAVLRFWLVYPGHPTSVPAYIQQRDDYDGTTGESEGEETGFPDWSNRELQRFLLAFYTAFAERYDKDRRLAYLQTGFGLWAEYHIYDGPFELGRTFPSKEYQATFLRHMARTFHHTPWMISVDAADDERTPITASRELLALDFGTFDDSFLHARHAEENAPNHRALGRDRYLRAPVGGEFSYYTDHDQRAALAPDGPHGVPFERAARDFHLTFIIGNDQPKYRTRDRIREAGRACGYRFRVDGCETNGRHCRVTVTNTGVAPLYFDAFVAVAGTRANESLKGLAPGHSRIVTVPCTRRRPTLTIACDRLLDGQQIGYDADLPGDD